jgi:hypothetical protein
VCPPLNRITFIRNIFYSMLNKRVISSGQDKWDILYVKLKLWVCLYVCSLVAQERICRFAPNVACLFLETKKRKWDCQISGKYVLSSSPGEDGSCSSETKHDGRTTPRPKLFVLQRRLQKQTPQRRETPGFESR